MDPRRSSPGFGRRGSALRHLFRGVGASGKSGWGLLSYLASMGNTSRLLALGYSNVKARSAEIATSLGVSDA
jgi:hypothetical protein